MTSLSENINIPRSISRTPLRAAEDMDALEKRAGAVVMGRFLDRDVFRLLWAIFRSQSSRKALKSKNFYEPKRVSSCLAHARSGSALWLALAIAMAPE